MATPFLSEIRLMSFAIVPRGWKLCDGQLLAINTNQALFSLLGTTFGGDGRVNFALPDLRGRVPIHVGGFYTLGQRGGETDHTLTVPEMPQHTHVANATTAVAETSAPASGVMLARSVQSLLYGPATNFQPMAAGAVTIRGGSQPHTNMQPYLTLSFCIAIEGIVPTAN